MTPETRLTGCLCAAAITAATCLAGTGTVVWTESSDADVGRILLSRPPAREDLERTVFETPAALVEAYLRANSTNRPAEISDAPVTTLCSHWRIHAAISSTSVISTLEADGVAFRASPAHPAQVSLFPMSQIFRDLRLNGKEVTPMRVKDCWVNVAVTNPGPFRVTAALDSKPVEDGAGRTLNFNTRGFVFSTVRVDSPDALRAALSTGGAITGTQSNGTHGVLTAGRRNSFSLTWCKAVEDARQKGLVSVKPSFAWVVGEKDLSARAILDAEILGGVADRMTVVLPDGSTRVQVGGPDVKYANHAGNRAEIFFRGAIRGRITVNVSFEMPRPRGNVVSFPEIEVAGGRLDSGGWLLVGNDGGGELLEQNLQGLEPRASIEAPEAVRGLLAGKPLFTYARTGFRATAAFDHVTTTPFPVVDTIADRADVIAAVRPGGEEMVRIKYTVRNSRRQFLRLTLPEGANMVWTAVEKKQVRPAREGRDILVPLAKSVQALEGLVSFPVDIVYTRRGEPFGPACRRTIDLPEIADVPTALVNAIVFTPDGTDIRAVSGRLQMVKSFSGGGLTYAMDRQPGAAADTRAISEALLFQTLSRNYYDAGYQAYRVGRLEEAEQLLSNVRKNAPAAPEAVDAENLLSNIRAGRNEVGNLKNREERARVSKVQKGLQVDNPFLEAQREALVQKAVQMFQTGNEEVGAMLFDEAEIVGRQLVHRGASQVEEKAVAGQFRDTQWELRRRKQENAALTERLTKLQKEAVQLSSSAGKGGTNAVLAKNFALVLGDAAAANAVAADEIQGIAFGQVAVSAQPKADLDDKVIALQLQKSPEQTANAPAARRGGRSLAGENDRLRRQVATMEQALETTRAIDPAVTVKTSQASEIQLREARRQVAMTLETAESLARRVEGPEVAFDALNEKNLRERVASIKTTVDAYANTYAAVDPGLERDVRAIREKISATETRINRAMEAKKKAEHITINLGALVDPDSRADQEGLARFFDNNVLRQVRNGETQFSIENGRMKVHNDGDNAALVAEALEKLQGNRGLAVPVTGSILKIPNAAGSPVVGRLFTGTTADGRKTAILDEGQYRALAEMAGGAGDADHRAVIVGTPNGVAGESLRVVRSGKDYNGIAVGGSDFHLPNNRYLAIAGDKHMVVLKADAAAAWQTMLRAAVQNFAWDIPVAPEVPRTGTPVLLEKTLLAAGESPDVVITYNYNERR